MHGGTIGGIRDSLGARVWGWSPTEAAMAGTREAESCAIAVHRCGHTQEYARKVGWPVQQAAP